MANKAGFYQSKRVETFKISFKNARVYEVEEGGLLGEGGLEEDVEELEEGSEKGCKNDASRQFYRPHRIHRSPHHKQNHGKLVETSR